MKNYNLYLLLVLAGFSVIAQNPGTLNPAFSGNGWDTIYGHNNGFEVRKALLQQDGKLLITAEANFSNEGHQAVIVRYNPDGTPDVTFGGGDGVIRTVEDLPDDWTGDYLYTRAYGTALQSNGKIIVAGDQFYNTERILRFNTDGALDTSFGMNGIVDITRENNEFIYHVGIQSNDKIIVYGTSEVMVNNTFVPYIFLWRFMPDGAIDTSFGNSGEVLYTYEPLFSGGGAYLRLNDLIVLPNDELLLNQSFLTAQGNVVWLRKMTANGEPDLSFGTAGNSVKINAANFGEYTYSSSAILQDGSILSTFTSRTDADMGYNETLYKVNSQGQIDVNFNLPISQNNVFPTNQTKVATHQGLFYVWTKVIADNLNVMYDSLKCYDSNGNPINSFGTSGTALITQNEIPNSYIGAIAIADNGSIYIGSTTDSLAPENQMFLAYNLFGAQSPLAVNQVSNIKEMFVYPNPVTDLLKISLPSQKNADKIIVTDILGQAILESENSNQINLSTLAKGIYNLQIVSGNTTYNQKIIKK